MLEGGVRRPIPLTWVVLFFGVTEINSKRRFLGVRGIVSWSLLNEVEVKFSSEVSLSSSMALRFRVGTLDSFIGLGQLEAGLETFLTS